MANINEVIDLMVANKEPDEKIREVINKYNESVETTPETSEVTTPEVSGDQTPTDTTEKVENMVSTGEESSTDTPVIKPDQVIEQGGYEYKFGFGDDDKPIYYTKKKDDSNWSVVNPDLDENNFITNPAYVSIGQEFNHFKGEDFDREAYFKQQAEATEISPKQPEIGAWQSFKNNIYNTFEMVGDLPEYYFSDEGAGSSFDIAATLLYETAFGKDKIEEWRSSDFGKWFFGGYEGSGTKEFEKSIESFEKEKEGLKRTMTFKEADSFTDYLSVVSGSIAQVGGSVIYNLGTGGTGFFMDFASENFITANEEKAKASNTTVSEILKSGDQDVEAPLKIAAFQAGLEYFGFSKIIGKTGVGKKLNKKVGEYLTKNYKKSKNIRTGLDILGTGRVESFTEMGQTGLEIYNEELAVAKGKGEEINDLMSIANGMFSERGIESGLQGFFGGTGLKAGSYSAKALNNIRKSNKDLDVEPELSKLAEITKRKNSTKDKDLIAAFDTQINELQESIKSKIKNGNDIYEKLSNKDIKTIEDLNELANVTAFRANNLIEKFQKGEISKEDFNAAIDGLGNKYKDNKQGIQDIVNKARAKEVTETVRKQVGKIAEAQGVEGVVTEANTQEIIDAQGEKLAIINAEKDINQQVLNNPDVSAEQKQIAEENIKSFDQQINDIENADSSFGYIDEKVDNEGNLTGDFEIIINKDKPMLGTAAHEFLHKVLFKTLKGNQKLQDNVGDAVTDYVTGKFGGVSPAFINRMSAYINPKTGEQVSEFGEEIITVMSESILDGSLEFKENFFTKIGDIVRQNLQKYGLKSIQFNTGRDVYNFIKDFNKSIEKNYTSKAITKAAVEGVKGKLVEGKEKTKPTAKRKMSKVSPKAKTFLEEKDDDGKLMYTNEMLVDIINNKRSIKEAVSEQMLGIFPKITLPNGQTINREGKRLLDTYNKEQKVTTFLDATLRNRQAEIFTRAKTIDAKSQGVSLDEAKNIAVSTELENETSNQIDTRKRINVLKIPKVARVAKEIRQDTKVVEGDTHKQVTKNNEGSVGKKIFNIPENKITKPNENLTTSDEIVSIETGEVITKEELDAGATGILSPSESKSVQDVFADYETSEQFIKILPKTNVSEKDALINEIGENIPVSRNVYGRAIGLQDRILEYFYEPLFKPNGKRARSQGKTSQVPLWTLKEEFINPKKDVVVQFQRDLGITEQQQINILPTKEKRSEIGQLLKGAARTLSQQVSLSAAQRNLAKKLANPSCCFFVL